MKLTGVKRSGMKLLLAYLVCSNNHSSGNNKLDSRRKDKPTSHILDRCLDAKPVTV